jgi:hypothetical protein
LSLEWGNGDTQEYIPGVLRIFFAEAKMATSSFSAQIGQWQGEGVRIPGENLILSTNQAQRLIRKAMQALQPELQSQAKAFLVRGYEESPSLVCKRVLADKISSILADPKERLEVLAES